MGVFWLYFCVIRVYCLLFYSYIENLVLPRLTGSSMGVVRDNGSAVEFCVQKYKFQAPNYKYHAKGRQESQIPIFNTRRKRLRCA